MLKVGILGYGNAGNQVVATAYTEKSMIPVFALNTSETDLQTLPDQVPKIMIGDGHGSGKNRDDSKKFLGGILNNLVTHGDVKKFILDLDLLFVVSSTGGGSGSGGSLLLSKILSNVFPATYVIPVGILPTIKEAMSAHANTLEYLNELYTKMGPITYMLYDNEKFAAKSTNDMMEAVNKQIVEDIMILSGKYNYPTKYASMDNQDMLNLIRTPGRLIVSALLDFKEKDIDNTSVEKLIIQRLADSPHVSIQKDRIVNRIGVVANINTYISQQFDTNALGLQESIGTPIENFEHLYINEDRKLPNSVYVILAGCSKITDRIRRINDRVEEIEEKMNEGSEDDDVLGEYNGADLNSRRSYAANATVSGDIDLGNILQDFGVPVNTGGNASMDRYANLSNRKVTDGNVSKDPVTEVV